MEEKTKFMIYIAVFIGLSFIVKNVFFSESGILIGILTPIIGYLIGLFVYKIFNKKKDK